MLQPQLSARSQPQYAGYSARLPAAVASSRLASPEAQLRVASSAYPFAELAPVTVNGFMQREATGATTALQAEIARRQAAEARVRELEALVARLRLRVDMLEGGRPVPIKQRAIVEMEEEESAIDDPIDRAICEYLERNPDFPVSVQKVAPNYYVFGDRGTVYVTQRGEHIVVRVGGGYKSLQVFMDERALMVTGDATTSVNQKA